MIQKEASKETKKELSDLVSNKKSEILLSTGKMVKIGYLVPDTQDKLNTLEVEYEEFKNSIKPIKKDGDGKEPVYDEKDLMRGNKVTRQYFAKVAAAILTNNYFGLKFIWPFKWRHIYHFSKWNGQDYLDIISEAKKKATEAQYSLAMVLAMDMTTNWTTMTKKEAEEYRQELELARQAQSLKSSQD